MKHSRTWTMERRLAVSERGGLGRGEQKEKNWDNYNKISNKNGKKNKKEEVP